METEEARTESQTSQGIKSKLVNDRNTNEKDLKLAIFTCVFCFFPTGIFAVLAARSAWKHALNGEDVLARQNSRRARILTYMSLYIGLFGIALAMILVLVEYHTSVFSGA